MAPLAYSNNIKTSINTQYQYNARYRTYKYTLYHYYYNNVQCTPLTTFLRLVLQ